MTSDHTYGHSGEQLVVFDRLYKEVLSLVRLRPEAMKLVAAAPGRGPANLFDFVHTFENEFLSKGGGTGWGNILSTTAAKALSVEQILMTTYP